MQRPRFNFKLGFDPAIIDGLSFFREPSIAFHSSPHNLRYHRCRSFPHTTRTLLCTNVSVKEGSPNSLPSPRFTYLLSPGGTNNVAK